MWRYYELLTDLSVEEIRWMRDRAEHGEDNPRDFKASLARQVISDFHSDSAAEEAEAEFVRRFRNKQTPDKIEERTLPNNLPLGWYLADLLTTVGLASSKAEARRLIQQGGVYVDGERQTLVNSVTLWKPGMSVLLKVGKRRFVRVHFS
jgi:tyrosyl-tRNA synthetase